MENSKVTWSYEFEKILLWVRIIKMPCIPISNDYTFDRLHRAFELPSNSKQPSKIKFKSSLKKERSYGWNQDSESLKVLVQSEVMIPTAENCRLATPSPLSLTLLSRLCHATLPLMYRQSRGELGHGIGEAMEDQLFLWFGTRVKWFWRWLTRIFFSDPRLVWTVVLETDLKQIWTWGDFHYAKDSRSKGECRFLPNFGITPGAGQLISGKTPKKRLQ